MMEIVKKNYLALGDSYTIGEAVAENESFPFQTADLLRINNVQFEDPEIIAKTGWTTGDLLNALNKTPPKYQKYAAITLLIGINNQFQHKSLDEYKIEFLALLKRAIFYTGNINNYVFVLSIPDYSVAPFGRNYSAATIAREIDTFNDANKVISINAGVHYIDITPISREANTDPSLIAEDGLHPSGLQYKKWSEMLAPAMIRKLK
jgi:lysophospholipase L1-like esterase